MKNHKTAYSHHSRQDWWHGDEMLVDQTTDANEVLSLFSYGRGEDCDGKTVSTWADEIRNSTDFLGDLSPDEFLVLLRLIANQDKTEPLFISLHSTIKALLDE